MWTARTSAPVRRSGPISCAIPICRPTSAARTGGSIPTAFALQAPFTFGSAPRNSVIGPGFTGVDLVTAKTWAVAGTRQLEFRWEIFNLLNTANFDLPNRTFGNANFGRIFSAKNAREMQFGARFAF